MHTQLTLPALAPWVRLDRHEGEGGTSGGEGGQGGGQGGQQGGDGGQGGQGGAGDGGQGGQGGDGGGTPKTFTQAELDRIVSDRLARQKAQYADYDDVKTKASKFDELEAASKTELERERDARAKAEAAAQAAAETATETLRRSAVISEAAKAGAVDPADVYALLPDKANLVVENGNVAGAAEAVATLLEAKPHLKAPVGDGRPRGNADQGTRNEGGDIDFRQADKATYEKELAKYGMRPIS